MGFRNIMISSNMKLRIQDQQLVVTAGDEVHIPLEDINCILIENQSVTLSAYLLQNFKISDGDGKAIAKAFVAAGCDPEDTKSGTVPAITGAGWT